MKKNILVSLLFILLVLVIYGSVRAFDDGIVGLTPKGGNTEGCSCHSLTPFPNVKVSIVGPSSVAAGDTVEYKLKISGGPLVRAGCDIAASNGLVIVSPADTLLQRLQATSTSYELSQIWPKLPVNDTVTFIFRYIAPNTPGIFDTLFATGNSINYNGAHDSDEWNYANNKAILITNSVGIRNISSVAKDFHLGQNYPNPFNPSTSIQYAIGIRQFITLKVYDVLGNEVATLVGEYRDAGNYETEFNADKLSSGVYYYQLRAGDPSTSSGQGFVETKKMILLR
jgi:hypothetical protein